MSSATIVKPFASTRRSTSPTRPRSTVSGFSSTKVRSDMADDVTGAAFELKDLQQVRPGRTDDVQRAGDEHRIVVLRHPHGTIARLLDCVFFDDMVTAEGARCGRHIRRRKA